MVNNTERFSPQYRSIRTLLDNDYHDTYPLSRQKLQDKIVSELLSKPVTDAADAADVNATSCQWIVFTAGCMGAGKSYTIRKLLNYPSNANASNASNASQFHLRDIVWVDPDTIRCYLPEFAEYCKCDPQAAGRMTNKESGYIAEILTDAALRDGKHVIVDGSLRDHVWHSIYFDRLRRDHLNLRIAIISVTAPIEDVLRRVEERGTRTGRFVPIDVLMDSVKHVPISVNILKSKADYFLEITNRSENDFELKLKFNSNADFGSVELSK